MQKQLGVPFHRALLMSLAMLLVEPSWGATYASPKGEAELPSAALARFEQMPKIWLSSAAFWMDDSHLIFSSSDANADWHLGDLPRIVIFDTATRKIQSARYSGLLYCYSGKQMIVDAGARAGKSVILVGKFGEPLTEVADHRRPTITGVDCEPISRDHGVVTVGLKPGDGTIRFVGEPANIAANSFDVEFHAADGHITARASASLETLPTTNRFVFLPWSGGYAKEGAIGAQQSIGGSFVDPKAGTITPIVGPSDLTQLANANKGSADVFVTKAGLLWRFRARHGSSQFQGLFLQTASGLARLDDHDVWAQSNVSPNGCSFFYSRVAGDTYAADPFKTRDGYDVVLLNLCMGGK